MAHTIKITFTDEDQAIVKDQIADIKDWVEKAVQGEKIGHGKSFMLIGWMFYWLMKVLQMAYHLIKKTLLI